MRFEIPSTDAACSVVSPAKNRSFTSSAQCGMLLRQAGQCIVERQELFIRCLVGHVQGIQINALPTPFALLPVSITSTVDENPPHRLGSSRKEMSAALPLFLARWTNEPR